MIPLIPVNKRKMSMSENKTTSGTSDHHETDVELENMNDLPEPQEKKIGGNLYLSGLSHWLHF